jgi:hypothetical protein
MYYVYELYDPRTLEVFYVGKGKRGRIDQHEIEARKGRQSRKCDRIREIELAGLTIGKRKVSTHKDEDEAYDAEAALICEYGLAKLTNVAAGGRGGKAGGPSTYEDRHAVAMASKLLIRVRGRDLSKVSILGHVMDLSDMPKRMEDIVERVARRRTIDWVNGIAAKYSVKYSYA